MASLFTESAMLNLRSEDLTKGTLGANNVSIDGVSDIGICDFYTTNLTWNNINMRTVLGTMYDKYDDFNITLTQLAYGYSPTYGLSTSDRACNIYMNGLSFKNNTYSVLSKSNTPNILLYTNVFSGSTVIGTSIQPVPDNTTFTFTKTDNVNINIFYTRSYKNIASNYNINHFLLAGVGTTFPTVQFSFKITGIPRGGEKNNELLKI